MTETNSILVIDDEDSICLAFEQFFSRRQWRVHTAATAQEGLDLFRRAKPDVVFLDVRLPDRSGLDLLEELSTIDTSVVVITAYGGLDTVVRAIQGKAFDYLVKPLDLDKAYALAERALESRPKSIPDPPAAACETGIVGNSPAMQAVYKLIARAAASDSPVLIQGETGTGKELVAHAIHRYSPRGKGPFVAVNCGAIPENLVESELFGHVRGAFTGADADRQGRFQSADGGTLLLDEIGELPQALQVKLLRVLDDGVVGPVGASKSIRVDVRVLASTNRNLTEEMDQGRFRRDLYYRLAVLHICLPPLRDRRDDIVPLACHFLGESSHGPAAAMDIKARDALAHHDWPGNVRELKNAIEHARAVAPDRTIVLDDLPADIVQANDASRENRGLTPIPSAGKWGLTPIPSAESVSVPNFPPALLAMAVQYASGLPADAPDRLAQTLQQIEAAIIRDAMARFDNNQSQASEYLGIHRNTLREKLREIEPGSSPD